ASLPIQRGNVLAVGRPARSSEVARSGHDPSFTRGKVDSPHPSVLRCLLAVGVAIDNHLAVRRPAWPALIVVAFSNLPGYASITIDHTNPGRLAGLSPREGDQPAVGRPGGHLYVEGWLGELHGRGAVSAAAPQRIIFGGDVADPFAVT